MLTEQEYVICNRVVTDLHYLLQHREGVFLEITNYYQNYKITAQDGQTELLVRFNPSVGVVIIACALFRNRRSGTLTMIIDYFKTHLRKQGYHTIQLESVLTPEAEAFAYSRGFSLDKWSFNNYSLSIK